MSSLSVVHLSERELAAHLEEATREILSASHRGSETRPESQPERATLGGRRIAYRPLQSIESASGAASAPAESFGLAERIQQIAPSDPLHSDVEHHLLRVLRRGLQVFGAVYASFERASGLERLKAANRQAELAAHDEAELQEKLETAGAASLFAFASYLLSRLSDYQRAEGESLDFELAAPPALPLASRRSARSAALHYLFTAIDTHARDDASLVRSVVLAARQLASRLRDLQHSLQHTEYYTRYHYRVEPEEVGINGFELPSATPRSDIAVPEKRPEEVVGNHVAKLEATRIAQRLACYDPEEKSNPFVELGGFVFSFIGDGKPGTGKTTLIQMIVTLLRDYCAVAGLPLRYENFSVDQISDYQGRSGQNARRFCENVLDPRVVGFGTVDDVDQVCGNRNDRNASAGQLEVTAVFMQQLAGANTVVRGNATFGLFSNHPEKVDDALRQRTQARFRIDGPETRADFADLFHILLGDDWELPRGEGYEPLAAQRVREVIREKYAEHDVPKAPALRQVFDTILQAHGDSGRLATWKGFGEYLHALQQHDARFTGRAVKNISDAVEARLMDFDLPSEWLEEREAFFAKPYETRLAMLRELRGELTPEIVTQEINRYAESELRYAHAAEDRELEERTRSLRLDARARRAAASAEGGRGSEE